MSATTRNRGGGTRNIRGGSLEWGAMEGYGCTALIDTGALGRLSSCLCEPQARRREKATGFFPRRARARGCIRDESGEGLEARGPRHHRQRVSLLAIHTMICGACERELPEDAYSEGQRGRRQSIRSCEECVAGGNQLVLMKKGRTRSEEDECPICNLPLPLEEKQSSFHVCCMKSMCNGCNLAAYKRGIRGCPFCRTPTPHKSQCLPMIQKRVDAGDPVAIYQLGVKYRHGSLGLEKDVTKAVELLERAAELGVKEAHYHLGLVYHKGAPGVEKDTARAIRHWEVAAMRGHVFARLLLGCGEEAAENYDLALHHYMISAKLGDQHSLNNVKKKFIASFATKADYAEALRGYQSAVEGMRSANRDDAEAERRKICLKSVDKTKFAGDES
ncbi:hypothetical protein THAOC_32933 [Thalassiosira oceanica]|uniref:RING-type domain-containing protein n=1 Tax=Thalassiosira oceanica TaxID=159749 RepID=K0RNF9_THAOC|nr:hypothetical protein THAOC_32933 [Thalassiosira oceanica]|eukprot:EJK48287.1 hypothetical protein THAOC_32933 [Thalassiosira oceanica]